MQLRRARALPHDAVDRELEAQIARVEAERDARAERRERVVPLGARPLTVREHHIASRHVVGDGVSEDVISPVLFGDAVRVLTDNDGEFALVNDSTGQWRNDDLVSIANHRGRRLEEYQRRHGAVVVHLGRVFGEVHADTNDLGWRHG